MEMVFCKIEYWVEGDVNVQCCFDKVFWISEKIWKKVIKQVFFILVFVFIVYIFLLYFIGLEWVFNVIIFFLGENFGGFVVMVGFMVVFYFVFVCLWEQVCIIICFYGRLQGVFMDDDIILVIYDFVCGEFRGKMKKKVCVFKSNLVVVMQVIVVDFDVVIVVELENLIKVQGDCIDCSFCVQVCLMGIDICDGVQLECVNCIVCMDVCDEVMEKIGCFI